MEDYMKIARQTGATKEIIRREEVFQIITENLYNYFRGLVNEERGDELNKKLEEHVNNIIPFFKRKKIRRLERKYELDGIPQKTAEEMIISATMGILVDRIFKEDSLEKKKALSMICERNRFLANLYGNTNRKLINGGYSNQLWGQYQ